MNLSNISRPVLSLLALAPVALLGVFMLTAIPWLKSMPDSMAMTITIIAALFSMGWSLFIATLASRRLDEVERASERFGLQYGLMGGALVVGILLCIPPFHDVVTDTANRLAIEFKGDAEKAPILAYVGGVATLAIAQSVGAVIACRFWWRSKS